jgi:hypothetical protein
MARQSLPYPTNAAAFHSNAWMLGATIVGTLGPVVIARTIPITAAPSLDVTASSQPADDVPIALPARISTP